MTERPIHILHVTFNMGIGGTEQVINQLVTNTQSGQVTHEITCIDGFVGEIGQQLQARGIPVSCIKRQPGFDRELIRNLREKIRVSGADIVHCHQYTPYLYGWLSALGLNAKIVFTEHGRFHPDRYRYKAVLVNPVMALLTSSIIAISDATRSSLVRYEFIPRSKIRVIYNGIAPLRRDEPEIKKIREELGIPDKAFVVGTVSRLDKVKNQAMMLRAFGQFLSHVPDAFLLIVGDGPERSELERQAREQGIEMSVCFTGFIARPAQYLALMDIFLLSSHTEGTSMTLLEAMSLGIPSVVTRVGGNPEIVIDNETGYVVESDNDGAFSAAMVKMANNRSIRERCSLASEERFHSHFSITKMTEQYLAVYRHCTDG